MSGKETTQKIADNIDTTNRIIDQTTEINNKIKDTAKSTASNLATKALELTKKTIKTIFGWAKLK